MTICNLNAYLHDVIQKSVSHRHRKPSLQLTLDGSRTLAPLSCSEHLAIQCPNYLKYALGILNASGINHTHTYINKPQNLIPNTVMCAEKQPRTIALAKERDTSIKINEMGHLSAGGH